MEGELGDLFELPIETYHGRVPFLVADIIKELQELHGGDDDHLFDPEATTDSFEELVSLSRTTHIKNISQFSNIADLSVTLVHFLNGITKEVPLVTRDVIIALLREYLDESPHSIHHIRRSLVRLYPGRYRTILFLCQFFGEVKSIEVEQLFRIFRQSFFGKDALNELKTDLRNFFIILVRHTKEIFNGAILGNSAFLTERQIAGLIKRHIRHEYGKFDNIETPTAELSPITPRNQSMFSAGHNPFDEPVSRSESASEGGRRSPAKGRHDHGNFSISHQDVYSKIPNDNDENKEFKNLKGQFSKSIGEDPHHHKIYDAGDKE